MEPTMKQFSTGQEILSFKTIAIFQEVHILLENTSPKITQLNHIYPEKGRT